MIFERAPREDMVTTADGVRIAIRTWHGDGNDLPPILFIHGYSQSHLCWMAQVDAEPLRPFDLIAYDLRGHGDSEKPLEPEYYRDPKRWSDELKAVIAATCKRPPVVVAWSYGGRVLLDYISCEGAQNLAGLVLVSATSNGRPESFGLGLAGLSAMHEERLDKNVASVVQLWTDCTKGTLDDEMRMIMVGSNMMTPPQIRKAMSGRSADYEEACRSISCPTLVVHGDTDPINTLEMARYSAATISNARLSIYEKTGHAPFLERPNRFALELAEFAKTCRSRA